MEERIVSGAQQENDYSDDTSLRPRRLIDYIGSWGPLILGHRHPAVIAALEKALARGTSFGAPTELETELAELVIEAVPSVERVRMVNSGTEATMSAIRLARGHTGRDRVVKFAGCYHGHVDSLLVEAGSGALTHGVPSSPGVPAGCAQDTIALAFNDAEGLAATMEEIGSSESRRLRGLGSQQRAELLARFG